MSVLFPTAAAEWCLAHSTRSTNIYGMNEGMIAIVISVTSVVSGSPKAEDEMQRNERKSKLAHPETHCVNLSLFLSLPFSLFISPSLPFFLFHSLSPSLPLSFSHLSLFLCLPAPALPPRLRLLHHLCGSAGAQLCPTGRKEKTGQSESFLLPTLLCSFISRG